MMHLLNFRAARQILYNRSLEQILIYENPDGFYVEPNRLLDQEFLPEEITYENAEEFVTFFEILILLDMSGKFSYRFFLDSDLDLTPVEWKRIGGCLRKELSDFEKEKFKTNGRLFCDEQQDVEKSEERQKEYAEKFWLAQKIKNSYRELMANIDKMLKDGESHAYIANQFGLSARKVRESLYSTNSDKPTISDLVQKILEDSDTAKKLGIRIGSRLYDEIICREKYKEFPKLKKHRTSKRIIAFPKNPVKLPND